MRVAILVDGGFFIKRYRKLYGKGHDARQTARNLHRLALDHVKKLTRDPNSLYRILYYDCAPFGKKIHNPISKDVIDFRKTDEAASRSSLHEELKKLRKVALRLGELRDARAWGIHAAPLKRLLKGEIEASDLTPDDVYYQLSQKGVDIKIGLDIASLSYKRLVDSIVLVSGDSDFVSAAKLARREGIDFILDPMWNPINPQLHEHIDGLQSVSPRPERRPEGSEGAPRSAS